MKKDRRAAEPQNPSYKLAVRYTRSGLSIIPIRANGTKAPAVDTWSQYRYQLAFGQQLRDWFPDGQEVGLGIVCGAASGGLLALDIDDPDSAKPWAEIVRQAGGQELLRQSLIVSTPSAGCFHVLFRTEAECVTEKLAQRIVDGRPKTMIETRGEGSYILAAGCPPSCHESGRLYRLVRGSFEQIPIFSGDEVALLLDAARSLNEYIPPGRLITMPASVPDLVRPGDDFNRRAQWRDILEPYGWTLVTGTWEKGQLCRPGKTRGVSATIGYAGPNIFYVFSSNAPPFEPMRGYTPFTAHALLPHGGDFSAAARDLAAQGYSAESQAIAVSPAKDLALVRPCSPGIIKLSHVVREDVQFISYPYFPLKLVLLEGDPEKGKTSLALKLVAAVTVGEGFPGMDPRPPANCLVLTAEDGMGDTIVKRLDAMGADSARVYAPDRFLPFNGAGLRYLRDLIAHSRPLLVVIDPFMAYLGPHVDAHRANEVRPITAQLSAFCDEYSCAVVAIRHLSKNTAASALHRGLGSIDFTAAARSVVLVGQDPNDEQYSLMAHSKCNLAGRGKTLRFSPRGGLVSWAGTSALTADDIVSVSEHEGYSRLDEAVEVLNDLVRSGPIPAKEGVRLMKDLGFSTSTTHRAKKKAKVVSRKEPGSFIGDWSWCKEDSQGETPESS